MRLIKYILFLCFIFGCEDNGHNVQNNSNGLVKKSNVKLNFSNNEIVIKYDSIKKSKKISKSLNISFQSSFYKDTVQVKLGLKRIFYGIISTDQTIGLAAGLKVLNDKNSVKTNILIAINSNQNILIKEYKNYSFLNVSKMRNKITLVFTNKPAYYK